MPFDGAYDVSILQFPKDRARWNLVANFLALRKSIFMDKLHWELFERDGLEFEQYDHFGAIYVIAHRNDEVLGGARLLRCSETVGAGAVQYSYMIRDAWLDLLPGLPPEMCSAEPTTSPAAWELTRLTAMEPGIAADILRATNAFLVDEHADECLFLGPPTFLRMARSMGFAPAPLGPITGNHDGRFLAFTCPVEPSLCLGQPLSSERKQRVSTCP